MRYILACSCYTSSLIDVDIIKAFVQNATTLFFYFVVILVAFCRESIIIVTSIKNNNQQVIKMKEQLKQEIADLKALKRSLKGDVFTVQQRKDISEKI
jgi:hypothetical protein